MSGSGEVISAAARAVGRVLRSGAYSNVVVDQLARASPDPARVRALSFAALRRIGSIDRAIERAAGRGLEEIDPPVLDILRVTGAELATSPRPAPLVVDGAVEAVRAVAPRAAGFANAVLRRLAAEGVPDDPSAEVPGWLRARMAAAWGEDEANELWRASSRPPEVGVRVRPGGVPPTGSHPVEGIPGAYLWAGGSLPADVVVQDPASVAVGVAAAPVAGRVLEVGAAPGGKTSHLADLAGPSTRIVALDSHPRRVRTGSRRVPSAGWVVGDGRHPPFPDAAFDLVVLDAPCSGLGTLRRRPELLVRVTPDEVRRLAALQARLVDAALRLLAPSGRLVYSVCTVTPEETVEVVAGKGFRPPSGLPGRRWGDGLLLAPHLGPTDGMFIAVRGPAGAAG